MSHCIHMMYTPQLEILLYIGGRQLQPAVCEYFLTLRQYYSYRDLRASGGGNENPRRHIGYVLQTARRSTQYHARLSASASTGRRMEHAMVTTAATSGYRGRGLRTSNGRRRPAAEVLMAVSVLVLGLLSLVGPTVDCRRADKRRHHWKVNVIKNHLKNHKSLEGMVRLVDGESEYEGRYLPKKINENIIITMT